MELKETYDRIAEDWTRDHDKDSWWIEGTDIFLAKLKPGGSILDVGCGSGIKSGYMVGKGFKVTGIDFSSKMIDIARRKFPAVDFKVADMLHLDEYPDMFDAVFAQASLLHIPKSRALEAIKKMESRLRPGGLLYIAVKEAKSGKKDEETVREMDYGYEYERFFSYYTMKELVGFFEELGLEIVRREEQFSGKTNWLQIIGRKR